MSPDNDSRVVKLKERFPKLAKLIEESYLLLVPVLLESVDRGELDEFLNQNDRKEELTSYLNTKDASFFGDVTIIRALTNWIQNPEKSNDPDENESAA